MWELNVEIEVNAQSDIYGCLNENCCPAMISFVKSKFDFLAAFSIVGFFFMLVAVISTLYMYKKVSTKKTQIFSHKNDNWLLALLIAFTIVMSTLTAVTMPNAPQGPPQPDESSVLTTYFEMYDAEINRQVSIGSINEEGWLTFERISLYQLDDANCPDCNDMFSVTVEIVGKPSGEFRVNGEHNNTFKYLAAQSKAVMSGKANDVNKTLGELEYRAGCITDPTNELQINVTF